MTREKHETIFLVVPSPQCRLQYLRGRRSVAGFIEEYDAYFMYDRDGLCQLVERSITGTVRAEYTRGSAPVPGIGDMVAAKINTSTTSYYQYPVYDQPGNVRRIVNAAGAVTGSFEYNAWGEKLLSQPPAEGTRFGFSAPAWMAPKDDPDGVFLWTRRRAYDAGVGRFLQRDAIKGLAGTYVYANGNPNSHMDPSGLQVPSYSESGPSGGTRMSYAQLDEIACQIEDVNCRMRIPTTKSCISQFALNLGLDVLSCVAGAVLGSIAAGTIGALIGCTLVGGGMTVFTPYELGSCLGEITEAGAACERAYHQCIRMVCHIRNPEEYQRSHPGHQ